MLLGRITHLAESGEDGTSTSVDDIELMKHLHVNKKSLITVLKGESRSSLGLTLKLGTLPTWLSLPWRQFSSYYCRQFVADYGTFVPAVVSSIFICFW